MMLKLCLMQSVLPTKLDNKSTGYLLAQFLPARLHNRMARVSVLYLKLSIKTIGIFGFARFSDHR